MLAYSLTLLRRRLGVVVVAVVLCAAAAALVLVVVPPGQQSTASVLFVPSAKEPGVSDPTNPLLSLGGSVAIVASVVQVAVTDDQTEQKLVGDGRAASYTVVPDLGENAGPILQVTAESTDAALSASTRDRVVDELQSELAALQASQKVPSTLRLSTVVLTSSPTPTPVRKTQIQLAVVAFLVLLLLFLALVLAVEHRSDRGRHRRSPAEDRTDTDGDNAMARRIEALAAPDHRAPTAGDVPDRRRGAVHASRSELAHRR